MKKRIIIFVAALAAALSPVPTMAGEPLKGDIGVDLVSTYVWRGQKLDGFAIQPNLGIEWGGLSLSAWSSTGLASDARELDLTLSYSLGGLTLGLTDYWCADSQSTYFGSEAPHVAELNLGYDFGPLAINWYSNVLGAVGYGPDGEKSCSSYLEVAAPFSLGGLEWSAAVGASPWANDYYGVDKFAIVCVNLSASKELNPGSGHSIPVFANIMANPSTGKMYFSVGISF